MSLDIDLEATVPTTVYSGNCTHNLGAMASACGIYSELWRVDEKTMRDGKAPKASELIVPLEDALFRLRALPDHFSKYNPANGWGSYCGFVKFLEELLESCKKYPYANVSISR